MAEVPERMAEMTRTRNRRHQGQGAHVLSAPTQGPPEVARLEHDRVCITPSGPVPLVVTQTQAAFDGRDYAKANRLLDAAALASLPTFERLDVCWMVVRLLLGLRRNTEAVAWCRILVECSPSALAHWQMAECLSDDPRTMSLAIAHAEQSVLLDGKTSLYRKERAELFCRVGRIAEGLAYYKELLAEFPDDPMLLSRWLWFAHYHPETTRGVLYEGYQRWAKHQTAVHNIAPHRNNPDPDRRLRIGILSPDFKYCSALMALELHLDGFDRDRTEVYGYGSVASPDAKTADLIGKCDHYRDVYRLSDAAVAQTIRADGIDILIENGGNIRGHRLGVLAYRPAPIQVDFGGLTTQGLTHLNYRFSDTLIDPPESQATYSERLLYLPNGFYFFAPPASSPLVGPLPVLSNGFVTFGSFNAHQKINTETLTMWAEVLCRTDGARLLIKSSGVQDPELARHYLDQLTSRGVAAERVTMRPPTRNYHDHLTVYSEVDIALDTFPFNGGVTMEEGLWMGVPAVTRVGQTFVSRFGLTILHRVGLDVFCAHSREEYINKAVAFAGQIDSLSSIRANLRTTMLTSPLCDPRRVASEMEPALRVPWRQWCDEQNA